jgi:hypothetical protein
MIEGTGAQKNGSYGSGSTTLIFLICYIGAEASSQAHLTPSEVSAHTSGNPAFLNYLKIKQISHYLMYISFFFILLLSNMFVEKKK